MMQQNALQDFNITETRAAPAKIPRQFGHFMAKEGFFGFERIVFTASGDLQRVISTCPSPSTLSTAPKCP
ncbi:hypothetical protein BGZ81_011087 [Podila clonocystis]|nr:hypothetical protein BGZ81_011087 [Podila clonocystis]